MLRKKYIENYKKHLTCILGYYQLKPLWKQYFEEEFAQFRELYKRLTEKLRPQVYELGFLK